MADPLDPLAAAIADRYTIQRKLGAGGMAVVYLADDLKQDRKVALEVLRPELAATLRAERFLKEIEVTTWTIPSKRSSYRFYPIPLPHARTSPSKR